MGLWIFSGDDKSFDIGPVTSPDNVVVDITDLDMVWRASLTNGGPATITKETPLLVDPFTERGITITDGPAGLARLDLIEADTDDVSGLVGVTLYWDLTITDDDDQVRTLARGTIEVREKVVVAP